MPSPMPMIDRVVTACALALQNAGGGSPESNQPMAGYFVIALVAVALGLVVVVFIRTSMRRSSRR